MLCTLCLLLDMCSLGKYVPFMKEGTYYPAKVMSLPSGGDNDHGLICLEWHQSYRNRPLAEPEQEHVSLKTLSEAYYDAVFKRETVKYKVSHDYLIT